MSDHEGEGVCYVNSLWNEMKRYEYEWVLGHVSSLLDYTWPRTTSVNEMNFCMNHAASAGLVTKSFVFIGV